MMPDAQTLYEVIDHTWPAARAIPTGPFQLREGRGGGSRVSAATTLRSDWTDADIDTAEQGMFDLGQTSLFMIREGDQRLDDALDERGYLIKDPVVMYCTPVTALSRNVPPRVSTFEIWRPLAICFDIWGAGGIGQPRWDVMERAQVPKTSILGRWNDSPAGAGFVGLYDGIAMMHALEILPHQRRQGMAEKMMAQAAIWAERHHASHISVICTTANDAANKLYSKLGMTIVGHYHYRQK